MALTEQQAVAVDRAQNTTHHLGLQARAGTGKSFTIRKMVEVIPRRRRVLIAAFNKVIEQETKALVPKWIDVSTCHALGFRALKAGRHNWNIRPEAGRLRQSVYQVAPSGQPKGLYGGIAKLTQVAMNHLATTPEALLPLVSRYGVLPQAGFTREQYVDFALATLKVMGAPTSEVTYDEMLYLPVFEQIRAGNYDDVLYDEAQDGNPVQRALLKTAIRAGGRLVVVYDDRQCIYQFRGADADEVRALVTDLNAEVLPLTVTFRCPRKVVDIARGIVSDYVACDEAPDGEVSWVDEEESYSLIQPGHVVIARSNYALTRMFLRLLKNGVNARIVGRDYKDKFTAVLDAFPGGSLVRFYDWLQKYQKTEGDRLVALNMDEQAEELGEICSALGMLGEGLDNIATLRHRLDTVFDDDPDPKKCVLLSSVHRAKGLQWQDVWVMESTFRLNNEEGENLYYVAITRTLWTPEYEGHLRLIQTPNKKGEYPPSIAKILLGEEDG